MSSEIVVLSDYKTNTIQASIRRLAGTTGTRFAYWPAPKAVMRDHSIDPQDLVDALVKCKVLGTQRFGLIDRHLVVGADLDGRSLRILLVLALELSIIEVVSIDVTASS